MNVVKQAKFGTVTLLLLMWQKFSQYKNIYFLYIYLYIVIPALIIILNIAINIENKFNNNLFLS